MKVWAYRGLDDGGGNESQIYSEKLTRNECRSDPSGSAEFFYSSGYHSLLNVSAIFSATAVLTDAGKSL